MVTFKINPEKIRDVIGKGGAVIRALTEETGTTIDIQDDGTITIAATSGEAAALARSRIDAITAEVEIGKIYEGTVLKILDFGAIVQVLPGKDGLLHRVRTELENTTLPVIIISTKGEEEDVARGMALGATAYLTKPVSAPKLLETIGRILGQGAPPDA